MAYVGCIAGAVLIDEYRKQLLEAGFAEVDILDAGSDLNAYAQLEKQSSCCSSSDVATLPPVSSGSCCSSSPNNLELYREFADLLRRYDINDFAASVRVFAVKPA
jgi:hypothetical protein